MAEKNFDLLYDINEFFKILFDVYTPRPHFILLAKTDVGVKDLSKLDDKYKQGILTAADDMVKRYSLTGVNILSVHRGTWVSDHTKLHIHLCAPVDQYVDVFRRKEREIPEWPSKRFVTKQWKASKNEHDYVKNVRGYPFSSYQKDDVKSIEQMQSKGGIAPGIDGVTKYEGFTVIWHPSKPNVGFADEKGMVSKLAVLMALENFYQKYVGSKPLVGSKDNYGGHICVLFNDGKFINDYFLDRVIGTSTLLLNNKKYNIDAN